MLIISHRGNMDGPCLVEENNPHRVMDVIYNGFDVEVDVWATKEGLFLGHDEPKFRVDYHFFVNPRLWIHCKNMQALLELFPNEKLNVFYHKEDIAITSQGFLITAPGCPVGYKSIAAMPELAKDWDIRDAYGVCTDYPLKYRRQ